MSLSQKNRLGHCRLLQARMITPNQRDIVGFEEKLLLHAGAKLRDKSNSQINRSRAQRGECLLHRQLYRVEEDAGGLLSTLMEQIRENPGFRNVAHHDCEYT